MTTATPDLATVLAQLAQLLTGGTTAPAAVPEPRHMPERILLTVEEAAEQLGIGRTSAWRLVKTGDLDSVQIGRLRRVPTSAIHKYAARLLANRTEGTDLE